MSLTLAANINSVAVDCSSINFSDTTSNYGISGNPNYADVTHVKWELYDSTFTNLIATYDNSGWTPYPSNDITLFASEFGLGSVFSNGNYGIRYTITYTDSNGDEQTLSCDSNTVIVQCGAVLCNTTLNKITTSLSGATYPATLTSAKIAGTTYTIGGSVSSLSDLVDKLNSFFTTNPPTPQNIKYSIYSYSGTNLILSNPYYTGTLSDYIIILGSTTYTAGSTPSVDAQVAQEYAIVQDCTNGVANVTAVDGSFSSGGAFPEFADVDIAQITLYQSGNSTPIDAVNFTSSEFQSFIQNGSNLATLFPNVTFAKCSTYYLNQSVDLLNGDTLDCYNAYFKLSYCGSLKDTSLKVKINNKYSSDCAKMVLCDSTGSYNANYTPTGYGIPNPDYSAIVRTEVVVTRPDGIVVTIPLEFVPSPNGDNCFAIPLSVLYADKPEYTIIPDGVYPIVYNVYSDCDELLGTTTYNVPFMCGLKNCLDKRAQDNLPCGVNCNDAEWQSLLLDYAEFMALSAAAQTSAECVNNQIQQLYKRCIAKCTTCTN